MRVGIDVQGSFDNTIEWLNRIKEPKDSIKLMEAIGQEGVEALAAHTPVATGETAASWGYELNVGFKETEISWYNDAHPQVAKNVARMIYTGHGTGWGGYVPPRDYITPAMTPVFGNSVDRLMEAIVRG